MGTLTSKDYWEQDYRRHRDDVRLSNLNDFRQLPTRRIIQTIESVDLEGKQVLEVGAGDSMILLQLASRWAGKAKFYGLDYTDTGCALLGERARRLEVDIEVIQDDLFQPPQEMLRGFDVVYSLGLVEHFEKLSDVLTTLKRLIRPGGSMLTVIPNMHGVLGTLTKRWNRAVYDMHNPHGLDSFLAGHAAAGLKVLRAGYLCSSDFSVLSSCFPDRSRSSVALRCYQGLVAVSLTSWLFERRFFELPKTAILSPFIHAVSVPEAAAGARGPSSLDVMR